ncbi:hypothetical protein CK203_062292 [Vitis vinifera]|uniref:Uncharacterized protein n=1 Tax=Vitis vinifera TaxID=29760 RepID=A0A438GD04_VITVI|nr:hypothetical protein CK203_062292 [Vitis vinifera]
MCQLGGGYLRSSLFYIHLELDISLSTSWNIDTFDLGSASWIRVRGRLIRVPDQSDQTDMDSQVVTVDQFAAAMASIQEAITGLGQRMDGQQAPTGSSSGECAV